MRTEYKDILKRALKRKKMSQYRLAQLLGVKRQSVNAWIKGECHPSYKNNEKVKKILDMI